MTDKNGVELCDCGAKQLHYKNGDLVNNEDIPDGVKWDKDSLSFRTFTSSKVDQTNPKDLIGSKVESPQNVLRTLPKDSSGRKTLPITTGVLDYFPLALAEVSKVSKAGNDQHNPGMEKLTWSRGKSKDHENCITRHLIERGGLDTDGIRHSAKLAWRALAMLQEELEQEAGWTPKEVKCLSK